MLYFQQQGYIANMLYKQQKYYIATMLYLHYNKKAI